MPRPSNIWLAAGVRTPFAKVDGPLSTALGHSFGATGARIISQAVKELAAMAKGSRAIVSICADSGQGSVLLLEAA